MVRCPAPPVEGYAIKAEGESCGGECMVEGECGEVLKCVVPPSTMSFAILLGTPQRTGVCTAVANAKITAPPAKEEVKKEEGRKLTNEKGAEKVAAKTIAEKVTEKMAAKVAAKEAVKDQTAEKKQETKKLCTSRALPLCG